MQSGKNYKIIDYLSGAYKVADVELLKTARH